MAKISQKPEPEETPQERVSNECQITMYCNPDLWEKAKAFVKAANQAERKGKPGRKPPKSTSALVVRLLTEHLRSNGPKVGVRLPDDLLKKK